jgi:outer membrane protein assembly factor BamA
MKIKMSAFMGGLVAALTIGAVPAANAGKGKVYILNGYSFGGFPDVNTDELAAKLKDQAGARITQADISADEAQLNAELRERHITGQLFTTIAEKHGRVWLIFDLQHHDSGAHFAAAGHPLKSEMFEGATRLSATDLAAATGLKPGDTLSFEGIRLARQGLLDLYAKAAPGNPPSIRSKMQMAADGQVVLTWLIGEP